MRYIILFFLILAGNFANSQIYTVNSANDVDDGVCDVIHCSLREAINASEADGVPSTIIFNIPGAGQQQINPTGPFPVINQPDLTILGETQPGGAGTVVIDFNYRDFMGVGFWDILAKRFYISGIDFTDFLFNNIGDHLFQFGDIASNATDSRIYDCSFITDNNFNPIITGRDLIKVHKADNLSISNCYFGTDHSKSFISKLEGYIHVYGNQGAGKVTIDSNIFVNKNLMIGFEGGKLSINKNIFGAVDTSKNANFLNPFIAIAGDQDFATTINDNFFFGFLGGADIVMNTRNQLTISKNRFHNNYHDMDLNAGAGSDQVFITDNFARNGKRFLFARGINELNLERNNISLYDTVYYNMNDPLNQKIRHIDNRMTCINNQVIKMDPALFPSHPIPVISTVNRNQITGTGNPNDSVVIYSNNRTACPNAVCEAGVELGRTKADGAGNWILNALYPNKTTITAFQFESNPITKPTLYSEFSACFQCPGQVKTNFTPSLCSGQTINFHGKVYSSINPVDSFVVKGDAVSICDSVYIVKVNVNAGYRTHMDLAVCYQDTLRFTNSNVIIHKNHLDDSLLYKTSAGCDSVITITGREVGVGNYNQTICDNASVNIFGTVFDKNNTSGKAVGVKQAVAGCDSIVFVNLSINNFTDFFLNRNMCPGQNLKVGNQTFDQSNPTGNVTLSGASSTGCDSVVHVNLSYPNNVGAFSTTICKGDSVKVGNKFFSDKNPNGQVTIPGASSFGCDTIINVAISIYPVATGSFMTNLCPGDTFKLDNQNFSDKNPIGQVIRKGAALHGCDTIINVTINVIPNAHSNYVADFCRGDTIKLGSKNELFYSGKLTGTIRENNSAANGCDSVIDVVLTEIPDAIGNFDSTMCDNQTLTLYGQTFSKAMPKGVLKIPHASIRMCDSFLNVKILFVPETKSNFTPTICRKDSVKVGNQFFSANNPNGVVRLVGKSSAGCDSVVTVALNINPSILLNFNANNLKCNQANTGELVLKDITGGSGNFKVSIDNGAPKNFTAGQIIGSLAQGGHTIQILDQLACDTTYNFTINNSQILSLQLPNDTIIKKGNAVNIVANINFNEMGIKWDPPSFLSCDTCLNTQSIPDQTISYKLTVTDENGCTISDNLTITVIVDQSDIFVPNVFSPNGDNINDRFYPVFKLPNTAITVFRIFDRWGNLIFEHLDGQVGDDIYWDGKANGEKVNPGVYVYAIQFIGEDKIAKWKTGDIMVVR